MKDTFILLLSEHLVKSVPFKEIQIKARTGSIGPHGTLDLLRVIESHPCTEAQLPLHAYICCEEIE